MNKFGEYLWNLFLITFTALIISAIWPSHHWTSGDLALLVALQALYRSIK